MILTIIFLFFSIARATKESANESNQQNRVPHGSLDSAAFNKKTTANVMRLGAKANFQNFKVPEFKKPAVVISDPYLTSKDEPKKTEESHKKVTTIDQSTSTSDLQFVSPNNQVPGIYDLPFSYLPSFRPSVVGEKTVRKDDIHGLFKKDENDPKDKPSNQYKIPFFPPITYGYGVNFNPFYKPALPPKMKDIVKESLYGDDGDLNDPNKGKVELDKKPNNGATVDFVPKDKRKPSDKDDGLSHQEDDLTDDNIEPDKELMDPTKPSNDKNQANNVKLNDRKRRSKKFDEDQDDSQDDESDETNNHKNNNNIQNNIDDVIPLQDKSVHDDTQHESHHSDLPKHESPVKTNEFPVEVDKVHESPIKISHDNQSPVKQHPSPDKKDNIDESPVKKDKIGESPVKKDNIDESPVKKDQIDESPGKKDNTDESFDENPSFDKSFDGNPSFDKSFDESANFDESPIGFNRSDKSFIENDESPSKNDDLDKSILKKSDHSVSNNSIQKGDIFKTKNKESELENHEIEEEKNKEEKDEEELNPSIYPTDNEESDEEGLEDDENSPKNNRLKSNSLNSGDQSEEEEFEDDEISLNENGKNEDESFSGEDYDSEDLKEFDSPSKNNHSIQSKSVKPNQFASQSVQDIEKLRNNGNESIDGDISKNTKEFPLNSIKTQFPNDSYLRKTKKEKEQKPPVNFKRFSKTINDFKRKSDKNAWEVAFSPTSDDSGDSPKPFKTQKLNDINESEDEEEVPSLARTKSGSFVVRDEEFENYITKTLLDESNLGDYDDVGEPDFNFLGDVDENTVVKYEDKDKIKKSQSLKKIRHVYLIEIVRNEECPDDEIFDDAQIRKLIASELKSETN